jgi:hypothetical protein
MFAYNNHLKKSSTAAQDQELQARHVVAHEERCKILQADIDQIENNNTLYTIRTKIILFMQKGAELFFHMLHLQILNGREYDGVMHTFFQHYEFFKSIPEENLLNDRSHFAFFCRFAHFINTDATNDLVALCREYGIEHYMPPMPIPAPMPVFMPQPTDYQVIPDHLQMTEVAFSTEGVNLAEPITDTNINENKVVSVEKVVTPVIADPNPHIQHTRVNSDQLRLEPEYNNVPPRSASAPAEFKSYPDLMPKVKPKKISIEKPAVTVELSPLEQIIRAIKQYDFAAFNKLFGQCIEHKDEIIKHLKNAFILKNASKGAKLFATNIDLTMDDLKLMRGRNLNKDIATIMLSRYNRMFEQQRKLAAQAVAAQVQAKDMSPFSSCELDTTMLDTTSLADSARLNPLTESHTPTLSTATTSTPTTSIASGITSPASSIGDPPMPDSAALQQTPLDETPKPQSPTPQPAVKAESSAPQLALKEKIAACIHTNNHEEFNLLYEQNHKRRAEINAQLTESFAEPTDISSEFLSKLNISSTIGLRLLDIGTKLTLDQKAALLLNILNRIPTTEYLTANRKIHAVRALLDQDTSKHQPLLDKINDLETQTVEIINACYTYLESLPAGAEIEIKKIKVTLSIANGDGENVLMVALRRRLATKSILELIDIIPALPLFVREQPTNQYILHYWARYLTVELLPAYPLLIKKIAAYLKAHNLCVIKIFLEPNGRDSDGNTFFHTLFVAQMNESLVLLALKEIMKCQPESSYIFPVILAINNHGDSIYSILDAKPDNWKNCRNFLGKTLPELMYTISNNDTISAKTKDLCFPKQHKFFGSNAINGMLVQNDLARLIDTFRVRNSIQQKILLQFTLDAATTLTTEKERLEFGRKNSAMLEYINDGNLRDYMHNGNNLYQILSETVFYLAYHASNPQLVAGLSPNRLNLNLDEFTDQNIIASYEAFLCQDRQCNIASSSLPAQYAISWHCMMLHLHNYPLVTLKDMHITYLTHRFLLDDNTDNDKMDPLSSAILIGNYVAVKFLHTVCKATISIKHISIAIAHNPNDRTIANYLIDNYTAATDNGNNALQDVLLLFLSDPNSYYEYYDLLKGLFYDPIRTSTMLQHQNKAGHSSLHIVFSLGVSGQLALDQLYWLFELLLNHGAKLENIDTKDHSNPLFYTIVLKEPRLLELFVKYFSKEEIAKMLRDKNLSGDTPLQSAKKTLAECKVPILLPRYTALANIFADLERQYGIEPDKNPPSDAVAMASAPRPKSPPKF